jgi:aminoglycoside 3-N-acetyltransferase
MRRCSGSCAPGLVTRGQMTAELGALGVSSGDTVMLHASVGAIGWIVGGADQVLHAVFDAIGEAGTLLMVVGWDGSPYDVTIGLPAVPPALAEAWPVYDPAIAHAVREWGVLAEFLRMWPGAVRSAHPDSSFVAVGPLANTLVSEHPLQYGMGERSPLAKLCEADGKLLLLGSPLRNVTLLHHAEHLAQAPDKAVVAYWAPVLSDGRKTWLRLEEFDTNGCLPWFGSGDMFEAILRDYLKQGGGAVGPVGASRSHLFDAADLTTFAVGWIEERFAEPVTREVAIEVETAGPANHHEVLALFDAMEEETPGTVATRGRLSARVDEFLGDSNRAIFLARVGGEPVGVLVALRASAEQGLLEQAYVDPAFRRRGVLREMEFDASGYLREAGCSRVHVHIDIENETARAAWRSLGYRPTSEFMERPL